MHRPGIPHVILDSIVVSIPACHAGDRGSIPPSGRHACFNYYAMGFLCKSTHETVYYCHVGGKRKILRSCQDSNLESSDP